MKEKKLNQKMKRLIIFKDINNDTIVQAFMKVLQSDAASEFTSEYSDFANKLFYINYNFTEYMLNLIVDSDNLYIRRYLRKEDTTYIHNLLIDELNILQEFATIEYEEIDSFNVQSCPYLINSKLDFVSIYMDKIKNIYKLGFGIFANHRFFTYSKNAFQPVLSYDKINFKDMTGYKHQHNLLLNNIKAFVNGKKASNTLLYGDAGCGKSSSCKALINKYYKDGLRMIEVKRDQISELENIFESLADNPLKFILFIDDLSFKNNDIDYIYLKNVLEGAVTLNNDNCLIFATSNRRHLISESMKDRDELFLNDQLEETKSLSARFGLTITFTKPNKDLYLEIVKSLCIEKGLNYNEKIIGEAEKFALRNNGRSPRTAQQFIIYILNQ